MSGRRPEPSAAAPRWDATRLATCFATGAAGLNDDFLRAALTRRLVGTPGSTGGSDSRGLARRRRRWRARADGEARRAEAEIREQPPASSSSPSTRTVEFQGAAPLKKVREAPACSLYVE